MPQNNGSTTTDAAAKSGTPDVQIKDLEAQLIELIAQKQKAERNLVDLEFRLYQLEGNYLEETAAGGNIVRGFDGYTGSGARSAITSTPGGGLGGSGSQKRARAPVADTDRIFSMSSSTLHKSLEAKKAEFEAREAEMAAAAAAAAVVLTHGGVHATPATKGGAATASTRKRAAAAGVPASPSVVTPTANKKRSGAAAAERAPKRARTGTAGIDEGNE
ncbi:hypothetical protein AMAG_08615 [Allomyces macrogynus ATCC 38327]|uniref:Chromatin modification-related protein EAF6 n=1 Tax=Allomyces macrogynus (strain ATCC 38327) TaxID=578462 RepID=A0A0L0SM23_ALLM3|nr:hypothetical protein AMAG_08615 [Allomyces macrogynus ATCC 38327]|eukprot:KNE63493.1 hypothetical protein AMAG_08615 [Allomyces macrogynus ATCC 38327]